MAEIDVICREELLKYLLSRTEDFEDDFGKGWSAGIKTAIEVIEKFPTPWKKVEKVLPTDGEEVLYVMDTRKWHADGGGQTGTSWVGHGWYHPDRGCFSAEITHWMEMPALPKEDRK